MPLACLTRAWASNSAAQVLFAPNRELCARAIFAPNAPEVVPKTGNIE
jgi:hypothetical protein